MQSEPRGATFNQFFFCRKRRTTRFDCDTNAVSASLLRVYRQVLLTVRYSFEELPLLVLYGHPLHENTVTHKTTSLF